MSIDQLIVVQQDQLRQVEDVLRDAIKSVNQTTLLEDPIFVNHFANDIETVEDENNLNTLNLTQLNEKYEACQQDIYELRKLKSSYKSLLDIDDLVNKSDSNLLDFQQLFNLFKNNETLVYNPNLIIYKHISKKIDTLHTTFITNLNAFLAKFIPNEFTIHNPEILEEFNLLLKKNDVKLDGYNHLKAKWDKLLDKLDKFDLLISENEETVELSLQESTTKTSFLTSIVNFIKFMNIINVDWLKHFFNSKISHFLNSRISKDINTIVNDKQAIDKLNELIILSKPSGWHILTNFTDNTSIEKNLNKLYSEYTIDVYIDKIRTLFKDFDPESSKDLKIDNEKQTLPKLDLQPLPKPPVEDDWNEEWGDNWDENATEKAPTTAKAAPPSKTEDDWDEGWGDDWEDDKANQPKSPARPKQIPPVLSEQSTVKISSLPDKLMTAFEEYGSLNDDLIETIFALSSVSYPPLNQSFLLYNDLQYLSRQLSTAKFSEYIELQWTRVLAQWYLELKILISSINITNEGVTSVEYELDDFNLERISSIHQRFDNIISASFNDTNPSKFQALMFELIDFVNNWFITTVVQLDEITEFQCSKTTAVIESLNNITVPIIVQLGKSKDSIKSYNKIQSLDYLVNNHLRDIMNEFYQGNLFAFETNELIKMLENIFIQSELRDQSIQEIIDIRFED